MSRVLAIKSTEGKKEIDYSLLSPRDIRKKIRGYEKQYGSYTRFAKGYDCESSPPEDYLILIDWECLLVEIKGRKGPGLSLVRGGKRKPR